MNFMRVDVLNLLAPFIDELGAAAIGRLFLWHRPARSGPWTAPRERFDGNLAAFYTPTEGSPSSSDWSWLDAPPSRMLPGSNLVRVGDYHFTSPMVTPYPQNDRVHVRRWFGRESEFVVVGLGGLVQLGYYWFDRFGLLLAERGIEFVMMDEPFNHRRTPPGYRPGELIAGCGPEQMIAAVRQAVIDARALVAALRSRGKRVAVVGQSYGGWLSLLLALVEPQLEFVVPLIPMCDLGTWYRAGLPLSRGARRRFPRISQSELDELLRPVNPLSWQPVIPGSQIDLHAARHDRLVVYRDIEKLARRWNTRFTLHRAGHYSVFFGDHLRHRVADTICTWWGLRADSLPVIAAS